MCSGLQVNYGKRMSCNRCGLAKQSTLDSRFGVGSNSGQGQSKCLNVFGMYHVIKPMVISSQPEMAVYMLL
jgi:hypothetical protein